MILVLSVIGSLFVGFWLGYKLGGDAERDYWIDQIKREERSRHLTQGNAFWQK